MPVSVVVTSSGTEKLTRLAAAIKAAGDKGLHKELDQALRRIAAPLKQSVRQGARQILPYRGGLADRVATTGRVTTRVSTASPDRVRLQIVATGPTPDAQWSQMDDGSVRHPVYGHRKTWVRQTIRPGWFTTPLLLDAPRQRDEITHAVEIVAQKLETAG